MLLDAGEAGDVSSMCAVGLLPIVYTDHYPSARYKESIAILRDRGSEAGHGACLYSKARSFVTRTKDDDPATIHFDLENAKALLLSAASQGYYLAHYMLFSARNLEALNDRFNFSETDEVHRALCWGRVAQQHTNWALFDTFLSKLRDYAEGQRRPDLLDLMSKYDIEKNVITEFIVQPQDCVRLEIGE